MKLHIQTLFTFKGNGRLLTTNEPNPQHGPRFLLGRSNEGNVYHFRHDLPQSLIDRLTELAQDEPTGQPLTPEPKHAEEYKGVLQTQAPIQLVWAGPVYHIPIPQPPQPQAIQITRQNAILLQDDFKWLYNSISSEQPCLAIVQNGRALSICRSVRIGSQAHEAGVETLPKYRGRGFAPIVVSAWASAVHKLGFVPLYSTSWKNAGSQSVARKLSMLQYGVTFHIT